MMTVDCQQTTYACDMVKCRMKVIKLSKIDQKKVKNVTEYF